MKHIFWLLFILLISPVLVCAEVIKSAHTEVELVSVEQSIVPGESFRVALRMKMDQGWHVYWKNPGDSGLAPVMTWDLPQGLSAGSIIWPIPQEIKLDPLTSYGYEDEVFLFSDISSAADLQQGQLLTLKAKVNWLACRVECIPGQAEVSLNLPVSNQKTVSELWLRAFERTQENWPLDSSLWNVRAYQDNDGYELHFLSTQKIEKLPELYFFPERDDVISHAKPQKVQSMDGGMKLTLSKSTLGKFSTLNNLKGVVVNADGWTKSGFRQGITVDVPLNPVVNIDDERSEIPITFFAACVFAFIGGIILNLMPCVLPVLSLKILSLTKHAQNRRDLLNNGLVFTAGVVVSFWVLVVIIWALKFAGKHIGWGFQFQSPGFVIAMGVVFFVFALNLFGLFEVGTSLTSLGGSAQRKGYAGSFLSGVLATIVATPCTAPFMGTALGFALSQPLWISFIVLTCMALGMAFPYLLMSLFPQFLRWVPKPGLWMLRLKVYLGFVLMGSVIWLTWVLGLQKGINSVVMFLGSLLFMSIGCWIIGVFQQDKVRWRELIVMIAVFIIALVLGIKAVLVVSEFSTIESSSSTGEIVWEKFSIERLNELRKEAKPVFIDFTAAWCLTCQVNDRIVFQNQNVIDAFKKFGIITLKADWTNHDEEITKALRGYGKSSIPLYVLYTNKTIQPLILPELITPRLMLETLNENFNL